MKDFQSISKSKIFTREQLKAIRGGDDGYYGAGCSFSDCSVYDSSTGITHSGQCYSDGQGYNPCYCHSTNGPTNYSGSHCNL